MMYHVGDGQLTGGKPRNFAGIPRKRSPASVWPIFAGGKANVCHASRVDKAGE